MSVYVVTGEVGRLALDVKDSSSISHFFIVSCASLYALFYVSGMISIINK